MQHQKIEYFADSYKLVGELIYEGGLDNTRAVIILYHGMEGRGSFCIDYAKNLATNGFVVFVADVYGDGKSTTDFKLARAWLSPLLENRALVRERALAAYTTVKQFAWINHYKIGAIGFCLGGMCMLEVARSGSNLIAGVSVHGVLRQSELETQAITTKIMILNGFLDPLCTPEVTEKFADEMFNAHNYDWVLVNFGNAKHAYSDPHTGTFDAEMEKQFGREYNRLAAQRSFRYAVDFFKEILV